MGGQEFFNQNVREGQHVLLEKIPKFPSPPPSKKKRTFPYLEKKELQILKHFSYFRQLLKTGYLAHVPNMEVDKGNILELNYNNVRQLSVSTLL